MEHLVALSLGNWLYFKLNENNGCRRLEYGLCCHGHMADMFRKSVE